MANPSSTWSFGGVPSSPSALPAGHQGFVRSNLVHNQGGQPHAPAGSPARSRGKRPCSSSSQGEPSQKQRRDRGPNWSLQEMLVLVDAKRDEFLQQLDTMDGRDLMESEVTKWSRISDKVMAAGFSSHLRDGMACKGKWHLILPDYRRVADYHARTGINSEDYWLLTSTEHAVEKLPRSFSKEIYVRIHDWFGRRPQIQPPHVRDLLNPQDEVFHRVYEDNEEDDVLIVDLSADGESIDPHAVTDNVDDMQRVDDVVLPQPGGQTDGGSPIRPIPLHSTSRQGPCSQGGVAASTATPILQCTPFPRISIVVLSDSSNSFSKRNMGNTAIRRKSLGNHAALVEVTKASADTLANQMKKMTSMTKEIESNKLEVHLKLFAEQMSYQRERDMRIYEQGLLAADNARLAILKQGEVVSALATISQVLTLGMKIQTENPNTNSTPPSSIEGHHRPDST